MKNINRYLLSIALVLFSAIQFINAQQILQVETKFIVKEPNKVMEKSSVKLYNLWMYQDINNYQAN